MLKLRIREIGFKNLECDGVLGRETVGRRGKEKEEEERLGEGKIWKE